MRGLLNRLKCWLFGCKWGRWHVTYTRRNRGAFRRYPNPRIYYACDRCGKKRPGGFN